MSAVLAINTSPLSDDEFCGVRTHGNPSSFKGAAIVAFIDLLGFSSSMRERWNEPGCPPLEKLFRIKETAEQSRDSTITIAADRKAPPTVSAAYRTRVHTMSDSIVVCSALAESPTTDELSFQFAVQAFTINALWECAVAEKRRQTW